MVPVAKSEYRDVDLCRKKFYHQDFSGQDLSKMKLRMSTFFCCNFDGANLTEADCEGSEFAGSTFRGTCCYRTNFKDARLGDTVFEPKDCFGMTVTLECKTFDRMKISQIWWFGWMFFGLMMVPERNPVNEDWRDRIIAAIGSERYVKLKAMFQKREM